MRLIIFLPLSCFLSSFRSSMMFRRVILIIWSAVGWGFRARRVYGKGDDLMVWEMDRDTNNYYSWLFQLLRGLFAPQLSSLSGHNLSKQEINLKDKRKEKFVNSRQCQQGRAGEEIFKSNRWDFHLIDIVLKINYVVYANLTEAVSLLPFHVSSPLSLGP